MISVNILCWNNLKTLKMTLDVLREEFKNVQHEIIVVDNGSNDGTGDFVIQLKWIPTGRINLIRNTTNLGISKGKNQGFFSSSGEYLMLLDGDVVPVPNSILKLYEFLQNNPDKQAIGFKPNAFAIDYNREGQPQNHEYFCKELANVEKAPVTCLFYGMYHKSVFIKCLMDESGEYSKVGYGWEDHDFYMQMKAAGIDQYFADMNHKGGKYYHAINSSLRPNCMGYDEYMRTSQLRAKQYREKWKRIYAK